MKDKSIIVFIGVLTICLMSPGFAFSGKMWPSIVDEKVAQARKAVNSIDMAAFKSVVDKKDYDLILDVREPGEFASGRVTGAVSVPRGVLEFMVWSKVGFPDNTDTGKKIFIYCKTGGRASLAAKALKDLGFTNVTAVVMNIDKWTEAGHPTEK